MATIDSLEMLLINDVRDLLDAENRITKALPKMIKAAESEELQNALTNHLSETEGQIERLERVFDILGTAARAKACHGMRGILEEGSEHMNEDFSDASLCDATIIGAAQKVEHYEIASYGTAAAYAKLLGLDEVVQLLVETLEEEKAADELLTTIAEGLVNPDAITTDGEEAEGEEEETEEEGRATTTARGNSRSHGSRGANPRSRGPARSRRSKTSGSRR